MAAKEVTDFALSRTPAGNEGSKVILKLNGTDRYSLTPELAERLANAMLEAAK